MKVLFATTNPAKIKKYAEKLKENNIEVLTIKDYRKCLYKSKSIL